MKVPRWIRNSHPLDPMAAVPLSVGIALWPLYVFFVWLLTRGNDWGFWDSVQGFLTLVPSMVADLVAPPIAIVVALVRSVPTDTVLEGTRAVVFWIVAVLAFPLLSAMMAFGPIVLLPVGAIVGLSMVGPLALASLVAAMDVPTMVAEDPRWGVGIAAYLVYVFVVHRVVRKWIA